MNATLPPIVILHISQTMPMRIYHAIPSQIEGAKLQPLNKLRETAPNLYSQYIQKYEGREFVLADRVLNLDCLWSDVLHFSPVHPQQIVEALRAAGLPYQPRKWFSVDPTRHNFNRSNTSIFLHLPKESGDLKLCDEDFIDYSPDALEQFRELPAATSEYFEQCQTQGVRPLMFCWVPHVLFRGELKVTSLEVIEV